jgi:formylglycine-generating enzyme required for sulfatase activity
VVGLYPHGTWPDGPLDLAGSVWEWCLNKYDDPNDEQIDQSGDCRVLHGGSWSFSQYYCRVAYRYSRSPDYRFSIIGFRLLRPTSNEH